MCKTVRGGHESEGWPAGPGANGGAREQDTQGI